VIIEYARNVLGVSEAHHAEYDPDASELFVTALTCSVAGQTMPVEVLGDTAAHAAYGNREGVTRGKQEVASNLSA